MYSPRENVMAILNEEQPEAYIDIMDAIKHIPDPVRDVTPRDGKEHPDTWGVIKCWLPDSPGAHPVITDENKVIKDIEQWRDQVVFPEIENLDWSVSVEEAAKVDRGEYFTSLFMPAGLFERSHFLMGMEDAFCNYLEYPEEMTELLNEIGDWKIRQIQKAAEVFHPDVYYFQDDWGSKQNLFLPPDVWREIIKPIQIRIADAIHDTGALYIHHADCICEPIVDDMIEIGIDVWQGAIPQNDILAIQEHTKGKFPLQGGVDIPSLDIPNMPEEDIRANIRNVIDTYVPGGIFFPGYAGGRCYIDRNNEIVKDELAKYGRIYAQEHPKN